MIQTGACVLLTAVSPLLFEMSFLGIMRRVPLGTALAAAMFRNDDKEFTTYYHDSLREYLRPTELPVTAVHE